MIDLRARIPALALMAMASLPVAAQTDRAVESPDLWRRREESRLASQRRDCEAQWAGMDRAGRKATSERERFIEECLAEARIARCHPPGNNPTCRYLRREERKARESRGRP
ncbi:MAG TPA: hypothetical protein PKW21_07580 [Rhabdaerophilum sp.]|nr:hypothetical protein [Rhabdaerophilum sp.]